MSNATRQFFDELADRKREPLLEKARGTVRFDLVNNGSTERWFVDVDKGDIAVPKRTVKPTRSFGRTRPCSTVSPLAR